MSNFSMALKIIFSVSKVFIYVLDKMQVIEEHDLNSHTGPGIIYQHDPRQDNVCSLGFIILWKMELDIYQITYNSDKRAKHTTNI